MRTRWVVPALVLWLGGGSFAFGAESRVDPRLISVHPFTGQRGTAFVTTVRGSGLTGARAVFLENAPFHATVEGIEAEPANPRSKTPIDLVRLRVEVAADAEPGRFPFRLITANGVSNALTLQITEHPVAAEPEGSHETPEKAIPVSAFPLIYTGRLVRSGEADYYRFRVEPGQTVTFEAISGLPQIAAAGSAATVANFDPALMIFEATESWFDARRLKRIAFNDEPIWVFGRRTDAHLVHRFDKGGEYLLRVEAFAGQGGPDYSYHIKFLDGEAPQDLPPAPEVWAERTFMRALTSNRLNDLAARGGKPRDRSSIETYRASEEAPSFKLPGTIDGSLSRPGELHRARFTLESPQDIAIEVETPGTAPPYFNPIVRLLNASGEEVATNVFASRGACSGEMTKSLQAKTVVPLREAGEYTLEIRDATADLADPGFRYRVQVRPSIAHVGQVRIESDHVNLAADEATTIRVFFDREENYQGAIAVSAEGLPPGVEAHIGADFEPDKDPPNFVSKRERYTPRTERTVVILRAAADAAPMTHPHKIRLVVRPLAEGRLGEVLESKSIPLMVIAKP